MPDVVVVAVTLAVVRRARAARAGGRSAVTGDVVGLVLAIGLVVYLVIALLFPERF